MGCKRATRPFTSLLCLSGDGTLSYRLSAHRRLYNPDADKPREPVYPLRHDKLELPREDLLKDEPKSDTKILSPPETRPISHSRLAAEVKSIYASLVMIKRKRIDIDEKRSAVTQERSLHNEQWQALIALRRQLLSEHHDFFLASGYLSTNANLSKLAAKYSMPARMWRHGIHAFLEVLRHHLPDSLDHMLAFIYMAYTMAARLYDNVPFFEDTWLQCLGELGRYRMAIEDDELEDQKLWSRVAHVWYNKVGDMTATVGRLYHHFAIFARPSGLVRLLFDPVLKGDILVFLLLSAKYTALVKLHGYLQCVKEDLPWGEMVSYLNTLARSHYATAMVEAEEFEAEEFPWHSEGDGRPLTEDFIIRGQIWSQACLPNTWLEEAKVDDEEQSIELPSMAASRVERALAPGAHITFFEKWIRNDMRKTLLSRWTSVMLVYLQTFFLLSRIPLVAARPQGNSEDLPAPSPSDLRASSASLVTKVSSIIFVAAVLVAAHFLAKQKGPTPVYGSLMTALAFGWWVIRGDASTSLWCLSV
ncbi:MAG: hypothetical protein LQ347_004316 [Umbilicaria vellea]|nr:MAG: hypothetical protein LQ347_004316 [Umbilicaria vellea]